MTDVKAPLTPEGRRRLAVLVVDQGWSLHRAAERFQCSSATAKRWADRYRAGLALTDRSSRPHTSPNRLPRKTERRIIGLRFTRRWGPHRIAYHLRFPRSTVGRVLARFAMPKLANIDQVTGLPVRKPKPVRYEVAAPGQLVHVDIKKQGRIPDGGGWRVHGRGSRQDRTASTARDKAVREGASGARGYRYLHHAVDDHSRVAYSEILNDERKETAAGFWMSQPDPISPRSQRHGEVHLDLASTAHGNPRHQPHLMQRLTETVTSSFSRPVGRNIHDCLTTIGSELNLDTFEVKSQQHSCRAADHAGSRASAHTPRSRRGCP